MPPYTLNDYFYFYAKINPDGTVESLHKNEERKEMNMTDDEKTLKDRTDKLNTILHEKGYITVGQFGSIMDVEYDEEDEEKIYFGDKTKRLQFLLKEISDIAYNRLNGEDYLIVTKDCEAIIDLWNDEN